MISSWTNRRIWSPSRRSSSGSVKPGNTVMVEWLLENLEACLAGRRPCQAASIAPMARRQQIGNLRGGGGSLASARRGQQPEKIQDRAIALGAGRALEPTTGT